MEVDWQKKKQVMVVLVWFIRLKVEVTDDTNLQNLIDNNNKVIVNKFKQ